MDEGKNLSLLELPIELLALIMEQLDALDLYACFTVCKTFNVACNNENSWRNRCEKHDITYDGSSWKSSYALGSYLRKEKRKEEKQ